MGTDDKNIFENVRQLAERLQLAPSWISSMLNSLGAYRLGNTYDSPGGECWLD